MEYCIRNDKNVFIRLNGNGAPVTCPERDKSLFEWTKANNILNSLPKTLKRLNFKVEAATGIFQIDQRENKDPKPERRVIGNRHYTVPESLLRWIEKFGICDDILKEAQKRKDELNRELSNVDKQFSNLVHEIEFEGKVDLYCGWQERNRIKENREKRRMIKDELLVISGVLRMDFSNIDREKINKAVSGLANRKFTYRIVEEEEPDVV